MNNLPVDWKQALESCNVFMARREIAHFFRSANQQAEAEGKASYWKKNIVSSWYAFVEKPCYQTACEFVAISPLLYEYFLGCCPGGALHKVGFRTSMNFRFGEYSLQAETSQINLLSELSDDEYGFFPRKFKEETIYHAAPTHFLGREWTVMVSIVQEKMIKWAASLELGTRDDVAQMEESTFQHCEQSLGSPTEEQQGLFCWDTPDGNVILQSAQVEQFFDISVFATSRAVRVLRQI